MHATQIAKPFHRPGWIYEEKVDGWRMVAIKAKGAVLLVSRNGHDLTRRFPELVIALRGLKPQTFIFDGEVAVYDRTFISRSELLRARPKDEPATLPVYIVGRDLRGKPLKERRRALERLIGGRSMIFPARRLSAGRVQGVGGGGQVRLRRDRGERSRVRVRGRADAPVDEGEAAGLPEGGAGVHPVFRVLSL
jgi:ATP-dependent DNA ligase